MNPTSDKILRNKRIGIFGKGGSGKSTVTVLLAHALRKRQYEVCVVDADSTNIGLPQALGIERPPAPLIDYFGGMVFSGGAVTCPVDDPTPLRDAAVDVAAMPPVFHQVSPDGIHLFVAGKMGSKGPGAGCDGPIAKIARDFRPMLAGEPPVTLIDFKAGFEDSARGSAVSLDWIVVVVDPTVAAVQMAIHMQDMVARLMAGEPPCTAHLESPQLVDMARTLYRNARVKGVQFVLNRVPDCETESFLRQHLASAGIEVCEVFDEDRSLARAWLRGDALHEANVVVAHHLAHTLETAEVGATAVEPTL